MKKQVVLLKGWEAKENYKDFYDCLAKQDYNPFEKKTKKWSDNLWEVLWKNFEFINFPRPNSSFADYKAWKIMFEKLLPFLKWEVIFVGHSLGGTFLAKYFDEDFKGWIQDSPLHYNIKKIILVAPAFKDDENEVIWSFNFKNNALENLKKISEKITIFWSKDDFVVPFEDFLDFKKVLPKAKFFEFENYGHFLGEEYREILEEIKK